MPHRLLCTRLKSPAINRSVAGGVKAAPATAAPALCRGATTSRGTGRSLQVVTGSTGVDDHEWGVTLFGEHPDDLKDVVYTMRYDRASADYGEFGTFYTGMVDDLDTVLTRAGCA